MTWKLHDENLMVIFSLQYCHELSFMHKLLPAFFCQVDSPEDAILEV